MEISVIVPVYNTKKYLKKCLDSIIKARIDSMEIIIINDGSTDDSLNTIKKYSSKYKYVSYVDKKNEGLAETKNLGIKLAKGKYISFIDSDDTINENFYKDAQEYINKNYDIIVYDFNTIEDDKEYKTKAKNVLFKNFNTKEGLLYTTIMPSSCNKIFKKELFLNNEMNFPKNILYEDFATTPILFLNSKRIKYINKPYYNYYIRNTSIMRTKDNVKPLKNMVKSISILDNRLKKYNNYDRERFIVFNYLWRIEKFIFENLYELEGLKKLKYSLYIKIKLGKILRELYDLVEIQKPIESIEDKYLKTFFKLRNKYIKNNKYIKLYIFLNKNNIDKYIFKNDEMLDYYYKWNKIIINDLEK